MGTFTDRMESIIQDIHSSREARKTDLNGISNDVSSMLRDFQSQRFEMARGLKTLLDTSMKSLSEDVLNLQNDLQKFLKDYRREYKTNAKELREGLKISGSELKSNVHNFLKRLNMMHEAMAEELRENLESNREDRVDLVLETRERFRRDMADLAADIQKARELWLGRTTATTGAQLTHGAVKKIFDAEKAAGEKIAGREKAQKIKKTLKKKRK